MGISSLTDLASGSLVVSLLMSIVTLKQILWSVLCNFGLVPKPQQEQDPLSSSLFMEVVAENEPAIADGFSRLLMLGNICKGNPSSVFTAAAAAGASSSTCGYCSSDYCAVCMSQFEEGQKIRNLRACNHCFHECCIDQWAHYSLDCPLCRSPLAASVSPQDQQRLATELMLWFR